MFSDGIRDPMDFTPEASRRARAFAVWAALQSLGRAGVAELVDRCCARARQFADALREIPGVEVANDVVINQIVVRFPGLDGVLEAVSASGACVMTPTTWQGEPGVRISVSNWQTTERDIEISVDAIRAAVAERQRTRSGHERELTRSGHDLADDHGVVSGRSQDLAARSGVLGRHREDHPDAEVEHPLHLGLDHTAEQRDLAEDAAAPPSSIGAITASRSARKHPGHVAGRARRP